MTDIRAGIARLLKDEFQIDTDVTLALFENGTLTDKACRDTLIKYEYKKKVEPKEKMRLKNKLADKYCVSVELVRKITQK